MPELRRFAPNVPVVLVGTKLGTNTFSISNNKSDFTFQDFLENNHLYNIRFLEKINTLSLFFIFLLPDLRDDRGYLADHFGSNVITSAQVLNH